MDGLKIYNRALSSAEIQELYNYTGGTIPPTTYQCSDTLDNDLDSLIDYPNDPGCSSAQDNDEYNAAQGGNVAYPANLELATVQAAVNQVYDAGGGTVYLPAGTSPIWTTTLYVPGGVNIIGAGSPMTIKDSVTHKWGPEPTPVLQSNVRTLVDYNSAGKTQAATSSRVANIKFTAVAGGSAMNFAAMRSIPNARIDHSIFDGTGIRGSDNRGKMYQLLMISIWSNPVVATTGVIDHSNFIWPGYGIYVGPRLWIDNKALGTSDAVFVEDCYIENGNHPVAGFNGSHWVFRYNYVPSLKSTGAVAGYMLYVHGPGFDDLGGIGAGQDRGANAVEAYGNTLDSDLAIQSDGKNNWTSMRLRTGKGVIWGNIIRNHRHAVIFTVDPGTCTYNGLDTPHDFYIWDNTLINVVPEDWARTPCASGLYWHDGAACSNTYIYCGAGGIMVDTVM